MAKERRRKTYGGSFLACRKCRRVYSIAELERIAKEREGRKSVEELELICPYCNSKDFTPDFYDIVVILDPEKSKVAQYLRISEPVVLTYTYE